MERQLEEKGVSLMPSSLSPDQRKAFVRQYLELSWNAQAFDETNDASQQMQDGGQHTMGSSCTDAISLPVDPLCVYLGAERLSMSVTQLREALRKTFPDIYLTIIDLLADGEKIVVHWMVQGTDLGGYKDYLPTGKSMRMTGILILRLEHHTIMEEWIEADVAGMLRQLGFVYIPQPPKITIRRPGPSFRE